VGVCKQIAKTSRRRLSYFPFLKATFGNPTDSFESGLIERD